MEDDDLIPKRKGKPRIETWYGSTGMTWSLDKSDLRRIWQDVRPEDGLTLRQAMLHYGPADRAERFYELEDMRYDGDPPMLIGEDGWPTDPQVLADFDFKARRLREDRSRLEFVLVQSLITGELFATGYASSEPLDEPARPIIGDRWRTLTPDLETSQASGPGIVISGILVFAKKPRRELPPPLRRLATAELRRWYRNWVDENLAKGTQPSRERDLEAAKEALGAGVPRELLRGLRKEFAPEAWKRFGRRKGPV